MTPLAAVVLAHADAPQVRRLVGALEDVPVVLHCDVKAPDDVAAEMLRGWGNRVRGVRRTSGAMDSWSLVRIELDGLRAALRHSAAEHIAVLSGADYPLLPVARLVDELTAWRGRTFALNLPVPHAGWNSARHPDGGRWRTAHRFLTRGDDVRFLGRFPLRTPWTRPLPAGQELRASSQWKVYARHDVERLLGVVDARPDLVGFWRRTLVPDESFVTSVLSSPALTGGEVLPPSRANPWFLEWTGDGHHPRVLTEEDFDLVSAAAGRPRLSPADLEAPLGPLPPAWFVRKVSSSRSSGLLDRIDDELLGRVPIG